MIALVDLQMQVKWNIPDEIFDKILEIRKKSDEFTNEEEVVIHAIEELADGNVVNVEKIAGGAEIITKMSDPMFKIPIVADPQEDFPTDEKCHVPYLYGKEGYGKFNESLSWQFHNRYFPIKHIILGKLAALLESRETHEVEWFVFIEELEFFVKKAVTHIKEIGADELLIGLPSTAEDFMQMPRLEKMKDKKRRLLKAKQLERISMDRFISQFFGRILKEGGNEVKLSGAVFEMGLLEATKAKEGEIYVRFTTDGRIFVNMENPLQNLLYEWWEYQTDNKRAEAKEVVEKIKNLDYKYSDGEREFVLEKIIKNFKLEYIIVQKYLEKDELSIEDIVKIFETEQKKYLQITSDDDLETMRKYSKAKSTTIMKRLEELGFFERLKNLSKIVYVNNHLY